MKTLCILTTMLLLASVTPSYATDQVVDILPPTLSTSKNVVEMVGEETHPIIRMTPDKSELIHLETGAASIIIGSPVHINVIADSQKTLVIVPRAPGATHFTILDKNGQVIMQRHVIVASPKKDYLKIKRTCRDDNEGCKKTSVFYCPDTCHEIGIDSETVATTQTETTGSGSDKAQDNTASTQDEFEGNE